LDDRKPKKKITFSDSEKSGNKNEILALLNGNDDDNDVTTGIKNNTDNYESSKNDNNDNTSSNKGNNDKNGKDSNDNNNGNNDVNDGNNRYDNNTDNAIPIIDNLEESMIVKYSETTDNNDSNDNMNNEMIEYIPPIYHYYHIHGNTTLPRKPDGLPLCNICYINISMYTCIECSVLAGDTSYNDDSTISVSTMSVCDSAKSVSTKSVQNVRAIPPASGIPSSHYCKDCFRDSHSSPYGFLQNTNLPRKINNDPNTVIRYVQKQLI
jgi:hypothetical protein